MCPRARVPACRASERAWPPDGRPWPRRHLCLTSAHLPTAIHVAALHAFLDATAPSAPLSAHADKFVAFAREHGRARGLAAEDDLPEPFLRCARAWRGDWGRGSASLAAARDGHHSPTDNADAGSSRFAPTPSPLSTSAASALRLPHLSRRVINSYGRELAPVCAVMGGLLGQEITKAISQRDEPLRNWFFYDASPEAKEPGNGIVRTIPPEL